MRRGTTPTHTFELPFDVSSIKEVQITYSQSDHYLDEKRTKVVKTTKDCKLEGKTISVDLTQQDTLAFSHKLQVAIQLRVLMFDKTALVSEVIKRDVEPCLDNEVLV